MRRIALLTSLFLAACATHPTVEPLIRVQEVRIPVMIQCIPPNTPDPPARTATGDALSGETGSLIQAVTEELIRRRAYDDQIAPVIAGCRSAGAPH